MVDAVGAKTARPSPDSGPSEATLYPPLCIVEKRVFAGRSDGSRRRLTWQAPSSTVVHDRNSFDRRTVLKAAGGLASAGMVGLAGCTSEGNDGGGDDNTVIVGPDGNLVYDPAELTVEAGTTVTWTWDSDMHNIVVSSQPDDASWEGTEGGEGKLYDTGHEYEFTFETPGTYEYYCSPHKSAGMTASVVVEEASTE